MTMEITIAPSAPSAAPAHLSFDPVCGSPLPVNFAANPFRDGGYTYYFCSAMCRRFFIDQRNTEVCFGSDSPPFAAAGSSRSNGVRRESSSAGG